MELDFVLTDDIKALMSMVGARDMTLPRNEGLNGRPDAFWELHRMLTFLGLADTPGGKAILSSHESQAVAVAMNGFDALSRILSITDTSKAIPLTGPELTE